MPADVFRRAALAARAPNSPLIYYYAVPRTARRDFPLADSSHVVEGLGVLDLRDGKWDWTMPLGMYCQNMITDLFVRGEGVLFAIRPVEIKPPPPPIGWGGFPVCRDGLYRSDDGGRTWTSISRGALMSLHEQGIDSLDKIVQDPDHQGMVCVLGSIFRGKALPIVRTQMRFQAADETYNWVAITEEEWERRHHSDELFFRPQYSSSAAVLKYYATLSNYFEFPFGERTEVPSFQIKVGGPPSFKRGEPVGVPVEVTFLHGSGEVIARDQYGTPIGPDPVAFLARTGGTATLVDTERGHAAWGLRRVLPDKTREVVPPDKAAKAGPGGLAAHRLAHRQSYKRALNLSEMCDFSKPGAYRVQLVYDNARVADKDKGEWVGLFSGPVFEINVSP
jgi:hypothetical protein